MPENREGTRQAEVMVARGIIRVFFSCEMDPGQMRRRRDDSTQINKKWRFVLFSEQNLWGRPFSMNRMLPAVSSGWQRSKGKLPEEDKEFTKALVKQSIKMEIRKKTKKRGRQHRDFSNGHGFWFLNFEVSLSVRIVYPGLSTYMKDEQCPAAALTSRGFHSNPACPAVGRMSVGVSGRQEDFYMSASPS